MQCYTILYTDSGHFLNFVKRSTAYFFHNATGTGGTLYPNGVAITNGPGLFAFPGGALDNGEVPFQGALREFTEECGSQIWFQYNPPTGYQINQLANIIFDTPGTTGVYTPYPILNAQINQTSNYYALYLQVSDDSLNQIELIMGTNLEENSSAAAEVIDGNFGTYDAIFNYYPYCPPDNELSEANIWQVQQDIDEIRALQANTQTDWYYDMIVYLANNLLNLGINY